jgi:hypothetical protein
LVFFFGGLTIYLLISETSSDTRDKKVEEIVIMFLVVNQAFSIQVPANYNFPMREDGKDKNNYVFTEKEEARKFAEHCAKAHLGKHFHLMELAGTATTDAPIVWTNEKGEKK